MTLVTVGMLLYYMKPQLATLRPMLAGDGGDIPAGGGRGPRRVCRRAAGGRRYRPGTGGGRHRTGVRRYAPGRCARPSQPRCDGSAAELQDTILAGEATVPLPIYREAAGLIVTYRDPAGRFPFPRRPGRPGSPARHRKPEPDSLSYRDRAGRFPFPQEPGQPGRRPAPETRTAA